MSILLSFLIGLSMLFSYSVGGEGVIIASHCYLFSSPSFESEKIMNDDSELILYHNDKVTILQEEGDFLLIRTEEYDKEGYVYKYYVTSNSSQDVYPVFNATIRNDTTIYDLDQNPTEWTAKAGSRVYIYGGFNENGMTAIQVVLEDGSLYNGLVNSEDLSPDGISSTLVIGISVIAAAVTIILSIVFLKKTKKKKAKKIQN